MKKIQVSAEISIQPGKLEEFKKVARRFLDVVIEKEKGQGGTLQYDWFLAADGATCSVRETYADSNAVLVHLGNVGPLFGPLMEISTFDFEVFGTMSDELQAATKDLSIKSYMYMHGLES
jgi:quinol monooxygenase YgiN